MLIILRDIGCAGNYFVSLCPESLHLSRVGQVLNIETVPVLSLLVIIVDLTKKFIFTGARIVYGGDWGSCCSKLTVNSAAIGWGSKGNTSALCKEVTG